MKQELKKQLEELAARQGYAPLDGKSRLVKFSRIATDGDDLHVKGVCEDSPQVITLIVNNWLKKSKGYQMLDIALTWPARKQRVAADAAALLNIEEAPILLECTYDMQYGRWQVTQPNGNEGTNNINVEV